VKPDQADELRRTARDILLGDLKAQGNTLSSAHVAALETLLGTMTEYVSRRLYGRHVYSLPTGLGKTSAIRAFFIALHRLGHDVPVSVAASKVDALCELKQRLMDGGIPEELIGLKHSVEGAPLPSTGDEDRRYMLVTHTRLRQGRDFELFGQHRGTGEVMLDRPLMIVDETLLRGDSLAINVHELRRALGAARTDRDPPAAIEYLSDCLASVETALESLKASPDAAGAPLNLPARAAGLSAADREAVKGMRLKGYEGVLLDLLEVSQDRLQVISEGAVEAVVWIGQPVPELLRNVLVLDASYPVKLLSQQDRESVELPTFPPEALKSHGALRVTQIMAAGGYSSIMDSQRRARRPAPVAEEVAAIIEAEWSRSRGILLFTYKPRRSQDPDHFKAVRAALRARGLDPDVPVPTGGTTATGEPVLKPKLRELTFGQETSLNGFEYCDVVILAGVLHRSEADVAAAIRAQAGDLAYPTPRSLIDETLQSEVAALVYQAFSRGSCRRLQNGQASVMRGYVVHRDPQLQQRLESVLPGARWDQRSPAFLKLANAVGVTNRTAARLAEYLDSLPQDTPTMSSSKVKTALGITSDDATSKAFTRAGDELPQYTPNWKKSGRSFVRVATNGQP
jgi:hypothetical protein